MPYNKIPASYQWLGRGGLFGFMPNMFIVAFLLVTITSIFFKYTILGRRILATGGNEIAAKMSAVNTDYTVLMANCMSGLFAAIAAAAVVSRDGSANPGVGSDWMIYSFAVAVIGGTSLKGGVINPFGLIISAFLIVFIKNGLVMINANAYYEQVYLGIILLVSVSFVNIGTLISDLQRTWIYKKEKQKSGLESTNG
jgi:ribose transport system permease protein